MKYLLIMFFVAYSLISAANLPDWSRAGLIQEAPIKIFQSLDITQYNGTDTEKITQAIGIAKTIDDWVIVYIPEGTYEIDKTIEINNTNTNGKGIIFIGDGIGKTILKFTNHQDENCFRIEGGHSDEEILLSSSKTTNPLSDIIPMNSKITIPMDIFDGVIESGELNVGSWLFMREVFAADGYRQNGDCKIGQFLQVSKIGNSSDPRVYFEQKASKNYKDVKNEYNYFGYYDEPNYLYAQKRLEEKGIIVVKNSNDLNQLGFRLFNPIQNIGFENFTIERTTKSRSIKGKTFLFTETVNCWVDAVESYNATHAHVQISESANITIRNSYFHHATGYSQKDDAKALREGKGYGVYVDDGSSYCLIENNRFKQYRHAILIARGANTNVFAYNYMSEPSEDWGAIGRPGCIRVHGEYPFSNLFEGNSGEFIFADPTHGDNGPYNTFYKNMIRGEGASLLLTNVFDVNLYGNYFNGGRVRNEINLLEQLGYGQFMSYYPLYNGIIGTDETASKTSFFYKTYPSFFVAGYSINLWAYDSPLPASMIGEKIENLPSNKYLKYYYTTYWKYTTKKIIATKQIKLVPGFSVKRGENFYAKIEN